MDALNFRKQIKDFQYSERISDAELAKLFNCSKSRIQQLKSGHIPSIELAIDIAMVCGIDQEEIISWVLYEKDRFPGRQQMRVKLGSRYTPQVMRAIREAQSRVLMAGVTNIRKIRNSREWLRLLAAKGGQIRIALMDPTSKSFKKRREDESEGDGEGLIEKGLVTRRLDYEFCVVCEDLKSFWHVAKKEGREGTVELRVYDIYPPPASLAIVDARMSYRYRYRKHHKGPKNLVDICWNYEDELFNNIEDEFWGLWKKGKKVDLNDFSKHTAKLPPLKIID